MKRSTLSFILLLCLIWTACSSSVDTPLGSWTRQVSEDDLGVEGKEIIIFRADSTFMAQNLMVFNHVDSVFSCSISFTTEIQGFWECGSDHIKLRYDTDSYRFDTIPGALRIDSRQNTFTDSLRRAMIADLTAGLSEYYNAVYRELGSSEGLTLSKPAVGQNFFAALLDDSLAVRWTKTTN